jgi:uncharacterized protein
MRQDIAFNSNGLKCSGWLTIPTNPNNFPIVIMAHGFGGTKEVLLEQYAHQFNALGFATLIFDYRYWGDSEGTPRHYHDYTKQIEDWNAAIAYVNELPNVNKNKIVLWGTSFAGGLVLSIASQNNTIAATISQCPMLDGKESSLQFIRNAGILSAMRSGMHGVYDLLKSSLGLEAHYVNARGKPGTIAAMATQDAWDSFPRFEAASTKTKHPHYNKVTARSLLMMRKYRPIQHVSKVACPSLLLICERDTVAPAIAVEKALKLMPKSVPVRYAHLGHFDIYFDEGFISSVADQIAFLKQYVLK